VGGWGELGGCVESVEGVWGEWEGVWEWEGVEGVWECGGSVEGVSESVGGSVVSLRGNVGGVREE
jgi:hypothetical protein